MRQTSYFYHSMSVASFLLAFMLAAGDYVKEHAPSERAEAQPLANCAVNAGLPKEFCADAITLEGNTSSINIDLSSVLWTLVSQPAGANATINTPNSAYSLVTGFLMPGDYTFQIQATCSDNDTPTQTVTHSVLPTPTLPYMGNVNANCYTGGGISLTGEAPGAGETVLWSVIAGYTGNFDNASSPSALFFPNVNKYECNTTGTYSSVLRYTKRNSAGCSVFRDINVTYYYAENAFFVEALPENTCVLCTNLYASCQMATGSGVWTYTGPGTATFSGGPNMANTGVCVSEPGTYAFTWTVTGGCNPGAGSVDVTFTDFGYPENVNAGTGGKFCEFPSSLSLDADFPGVGQIGTWKQLEGLPVTIVDVNDPKTLVTGLEVGGGPYWFGWEVQGASAGGGCPVVDTVQFYEVPKMIWTPSVYPECYGFSESPTYPLLSSNYMPGKAIDTLVITVTMLEKPTLASSQLEVGVKARKVSTGQPGGYACYRDYDVSPSATFNISGNTATQVLCNQEFLTGWDYRFDINYYRYLYPGQYTIQFDIWNGCETYSAIHTYNFGVLYDFTCLL